jgi:trk system potassium uptake protein
MRLVLSIAPLLGALLIGFSAVFMLPIAWSLAVNDGAYRPFVGTGLGGFIVGVALLAATRRFRRELQARAGCLLVVLAWVAFAALAAVPLMLTITNLSFTDAFFETMAALTTSAGTVLVGLDALPPSVNLWRHALQWFGGMAILLLAVAVMPMLGVGGMQSFKAESPGPMKDVKLTPRVMQTAKYLWLLYAGLTAVCVAALRSAGMSWLDAVCHAFSVISLGGFSTHDRNLSYFDSTAIELVLSVFMMIAVLGFSSHFLALRQRSLRVYYRDTEVFAVITLILGSCLMLAAFLFWKAVYPDFWTALRFASFNAISMASSSGYASTNFAQWPVFAPVWMLALCCVASSAGSTGGGIKMIRALILMKQAKYELIRLVHPRAVTPLCIGGQIVANRVILSVLGYMLLYGATVAVLTLALLATDLDLVSALTGVIASVNNTGPGLNALGPAGNYQSLSDLQTWVCTIAMLAGRLELLMLFVLFTPSFWRD